MRIKHLFLAVMLVAAVTELAAQTSGDDSYQRLYYKELNFSYNPLATMSTPIKNSYNVVSSVGVADFSYSLTDGEYRNVESSQKIANIGFDIDGLKKIGRFSFEGGINYDNFAEQESAWAGTYMLLEHNPFKFGAESGGDRSKEEYNIYGGASYDFRRLSLAVKLGYNTASVYDISDPRAEINSMRFKVEPAAMYSIKEGFKVGLSGKIELFNSALSHSIVNNNESHSYYLMMGCGNFYLSSTGVSISYPRDYKGDNNSASLQLLFGKPTSTLQNATEISYGKAEEITKDGSGAAVFRGGDYFSNTISAKNRTTIGGNGSLVSNIDLGFSMTTDEGYWYDQKRVVNTSQGNLVTYKILQRYQLYQATILNATAAYQLDIVKEKLPLYSFVVDGGFNSANKSSNNGTLFSENYSNIDLGATIKKYWNLEKMAIEVGAQFRMHKIMGSPLYSGKTLDITEKYTYPYVGYLFSDNMLLGAEVKASRRVNVAKRVMLVGLGLGGYIQNPNGENKYHDFSGENRNCIQANLFLNF